MKISATKSAIIAFSPIGLISEHAISKNNSSMLKRYPNQQMYDNGLKYKNGKQECALPDLREKSVCRKQNKSVNKSANVCFGGFFNAQNIYKSNLFKKSLEFASDNGALFAAGIALFTTTILRPITIFATPGVKKENKEYASAKSISSGVIGFGIMAALSTPIATAIKKINSNPAKYLKEATIKNLSEGKNLLTSQKYKFSTQLFKLGTDFVTAIPKAVLTCALIPPIMLCLFPKKQKEAKYQTPGSLICFKSAKFDKRSNQIFKGFIKEGK